ncbi:MAG: ferritin-like domain-containing protein [Chloroflexi bacterium]|nr:ferritin-like domain-containing protein [Chloroflexota bacterium]
MAVDQDTMRVMKTDSAETAPVDLSWLDLDQTWGISAKPGKRGLTLDEVNIGPYGPNGDGAADMTNRARGVAKREGVPRSGYYLDKKADVWSDNTTMLYEEAVQRQWSSATDIPWEGIEELPDEIERAMCQLCTFLTEVEFIAGDTPGQWVPRISNEHFETKLFLCSQIMDEARHLDVFRKRALVNGGGLMMASPTSSLRTILNAQDFTEMSAIMHVQAEGFIQSMFRMGELIAQNEAEKRMFRLCAQDESRHLGFGVMHLKYVLANEPERREEIHAYLDEAENADPETGTFGIQVAESLIILLGGGKANADEGFNRFMALRKRQVLEYLHRLNVAGMDDRADRMDPMMRMMLAV